MTETAFDTVPSGTLLIDAAARVLGVSRRTVYYRIREGRLRTIRTRNGSQRVLRSSIEALLEGREPQAPAQAMCAPAVSTYTAYSD